ncbi:MAG: hypothetical protein CL752_01255 [Chloroflexi bacterium]|nr:hypothetical protein [Chloroflexota bacterium]|tara:strand:+ start:2862 stop:3245 length:384 start_codon:yes stop_codon:yes gene_type:complete
MSTEAQTTESHGSPLTPRDYIKIGLILTVITIVELIASYVELGALLIPILLFLSLVKFVAVVALFMHLKYEARILTQMFVMGAVLATCILIGLLYLFRNDPTDALGGVDPASGGHAARIWIGHYLHI